MTFRDQLRVARRPRLLVMLAVLLVAAAVFARLGVWQLDRAVQKGEARAAAEAAQTAQAPPAVLDDVLAPQTTFRSTMVATHVTVTGEYEDDALVVTGRVVDGQAVVLALAPFRVETSGAVIAVVRGWAAPDEGLPAPPEGSVTLTGWLQAGEAGGALAGSTTDAISPAQLVNRWGGPIYTAYLVVEASTPAEPLASLGLPEAPSGVDWRSLGYALQWWVFGFFAVALWWRMVRDEAADAAVAAADAAVDGPVTERAERR